MITEIDKTHYKLLLSVNEFNKIIEKDNVSETKLFDLINKIPGIFNVSYSSHDEPVIYYLVPYLQDNQSLHEHVKLTTQKYINS
jgi:hypothetical protein